MSYIKRMLENLGDPETVRRRLLRRGIQHPAQPYPGRRRPAKPYARRGESHNYTPPRPAPAPAQRAARLSRRPGATLPQEPTRTPDDVNADLFGED